MSSTAINERERAELDMLRKMYQKGIAQSPENIVVPPKKRRVATKEEKLLRELVRANTLRRFDPIVANKDNKLFCHRLLQSASGEKRWSQRKYMDEALFDQLAKPVLAEIIKTNACGADWMQVLEIFETMKKIVKERYKNHMQDIKDKAKGKPKELRFQCPLDRRIEELKMLGLDVNGRSLKDVVSGRPFKRKLEVCQTPIKKRHRQYKSALRYASPPPPHSPLHHHKYPLSLCTTLLFTYQPPPPFLAHRKRLSFVETPPRRVSSNAEAPSRVRRMSRDGKAPPARALSNAEASPRPRRVSRDGKAPPRRVSPNAESLPSPQQESQKVWEDSTDESLLSDNSESEWVVSDSDDSVWDSDEDKDWVPKSAFTPVRRKIEPLKGSDPTPGFLRPPTINDLPECIDLVSSEEEEGNFNWVQSCVQHGARGSPPPVSAKNRSPTPLPSPSDHLLSK